jgi:C4-dicarboxylate transporter DctM subunit
MDPIHFGVIFVVTNEIAFLTPPLGVNLFVAMQLGDISLERIGKAVLPYILVLIVCVVILTAWPQLSLILPHLFGFGK